MLMRARAAVLISTLLIGSLMVTVYDLFFPPVPIQQMKHTVKDELKKAGQKLTNSFQQKNEFDNKLSNLANRRSQGK